MPVVLEIGLFKVSVHANEGNHVRPHVHVTFRDIALVVALDDLEVLDVKGLRGKRLRIIMQTIEKHREELLVAWREYHG